MTIWLPEIFPYMHLPSTLKKLWWKGGFLVIRKFQKWNSLKWSCVFLLWDVNDFRTILTFTPHGLTESLGLSGSTSLSQHESLYTKNLDEGVPEAQALWLRLRRTHWLSPCRALSRIWYYCLDVQTLLGPREWMHTYNYILTACHWWLNLTFCMF